LRHVRAQCSDIPDDQCVGLDDNELQAKVELAQEQLSQEYLFIGSASINKVYEFVSIVTEMMVTVQAIKNSNELNKRILETTAIYEAAGKAADSLAKIQSAILEQHTTAVPATASFVASEIPAVRSCCGMPPSPQEVARLNEFIQQQSAQFAQDHSEAVKTAFSAPPD
jgi:hypothetical protein